MTSQSQCPGIDKHFQAEERSPKDPYLTDLSWLGPWPQSPAQPSEFPILCRGPLACGFRDTAMLDMM
jgi:hypothetical protein